ncbi:hypothetical protein RRG08_046095 [Elysia crispata]|uniref:Uncharacterized protein n=1 Tax=Elysia crispata TaxID=231223 RepID=A0AAE1CSU6_9GAST|nr:hypothetical protein RRG08_046095 [Elysia crispata]
MLVLSHALAYSVKYACAISCLDVLCEVRLCSHSLMYPVNSQVLSHSLMYSVKYAWAMSHLGILSEVRKCYVAP